MNQLDANRALDAAKDRRTGYRVVSSPFYTPAQLSLAKRYSTLEGAFSDMGDGLVIGPEGVAAFHERHWYTLDRYPSLLNR